MDAGRRFGCSGVTGLVRSLSDGVAAQLWDLADKLAAVGIKDNERNISNKIGRGTFSAIFFVQCMEAIGCRTIHLESE